MKRLITLTTLTILINQILVAGAYGGGSGTSENPYLISNASHLSELSSTSSDWGTGIYFEQTNGITVTGEWSPIGNSTTNFRGSYDGQGFTVSGVSINNSSTNAGFFGYTYGATIQNLGLENLSISANSSVGGLIGYAQATTVNNCYTTGGVSGYYGYVGGLIGQTWGAIISDSYSTATVSGGTSGSGSYTGGLIGRCSNNSTVSNSYHITGSVSGKDYVGGLIGNAGSGDAITKCYTTGASYGLLQTGGLVGNNGATINDCYSRASATSSNNETGGFVGKNTGTITNSYSTGVPLSQNNNQYEGGFAGNNTGTITNCFWDTQTSGQGSSAGGTGKTTEQMTTQSTFIDAEWSNETWFMDAGFNNGYPYLHWQNEGTPLPVELTSFIAYVVDYVVELRWLTSTEVDNYGFEITRCENSNVKGETWQTVGFVQGHGNSNSVKSYSFTDKNLKSGKYLYRLKMIDTDGSFEYSNEVEVDITLPTEFTLMQNYPNPFNAQTKIKFAIPPGANNNKVTLKLFNILGEEIKTLLNEELEAGFHEVDFNASNLASGVFIYRLEWDDKFKVKKMMMIK